MYSIKRFAALVFAILVLTRGTGVQAQTALDDTLKPYLAKYELPALAAAVVVEGKVVAAGAVGTRKHGAAIPVTLHDRFHIGSDTKAMTATLAAMFVEAGKIRWDAKVGDILPEVTKKGDTELKNVTLEQLLSHTSGIPSDNDAFMKLLAQSLLRDGNLDQVRLWMVQEWAKQPLKAKPGEKFAYANMNYVIAGAMLERVSGKSWEELIVERIFGPLALQSAGLGAPATVGKIDAPLGHIRTEAKVDVYMPGPNGDNALVIGPAGTAHMSILDFARWGAWNAGQGKRGPKLIQPETLTKLHTPVTTMFDRKDAKPGTPARGKYGLGWGELKVEWAPDPLLHHAGSNGKFLAQIWVDLKRDVAIVITANIANPKADAAFFALTQELYTQFVAPQGTGKEEAKVDPRVHPVTEKVADKTQEAWTAAWWQWAFSIKKARNPIGDKTGEFAAEGQSGPVWFLAGTTGGTATRKCTIPAGKSILVPILNYCQTEVPVKAKEKQLLAEARKVMDGVQGMEVILDDKPIANLKAQRISSALFAFTGPEKADEALFPEDIGKRVGVSDGYWLLLKPLQPGKHTLRFKGKVVAEKKEDSFELDVTYHLEVEASK